MHFQREYLPAIFEEIKPLISKHYLEIAHYQDIPLNPDWDAYKNAEDAGAIRAFTVRNADMALIGYQIFFVKHNIHYKSSKQASQDILFIDPDYRRSSVGYNFIDWCDSQLREEGVQAVYQHVKAEHNFGPLLEKLDYKLVDLIYARRLDSKGVE